MSDQWEYKGMAISLDERKKVWKSNLSEIPPQEDIYMILNHFGAQGWELVNLAQEYGGQGPGGWNVKGYYAVFKRRKQ